MTTKNDVPFTAVPNLIIDHCWKVLSASAYILLICIIRKTLGWHKEIDNIALTQFQKSSGLTRTTCVRGLRELKEIGFSVEFGVSKDGKKYGLAPIEQIKQILESKGVNTQSNSEVKQNCIIKNFILDDNIDQSSLIAGPLPVQKPDIQNKVKQTYKNKIKTDNSIVLDDFNIPRNVNKERLIQFIEMRRMKNNPLYPIALELLLDRLKEYGEDANESLCNAIIGNFDNIVPIKKRINTSASELNRRNSLTSGKISTYKKKNNIWPKDVALERVSEGE